MGRRKGIGGRKREGRRERGKRKGKFLTSNEAMFSSTALSARK